MFQKSGNDCPTGFYKFGNYCKRISSSDRDALPRENGGKCPTGWYKSGGYCVKQQPAIALAPIVKKIIVIIEILQKYLPYFIESQQYQMVKDWVLFSRNPCSAWYCQDLVDCCVYRGGMWKVAIKKSQHRPGPCRCNWG
jgi:hypothetical protein